MYITWRPSTFTGCYQWIITITRKANKLHGWNTRTLFKVCTNTMLLWYKEASQPNSYQNILSNSLISKITTYLKNLTYDKYDRLLNLSFEMFPWILTNSDLHCLGVLSHIYYSLDVAEKKFKKWTNKTLLLIKNFLNDLLSLNGYII